MYENFAAVVLGLVEGVTEFLPISSTAHLALTSRLLGLEQTEFQKSFEIVIQLGAILAVVVAYWRTLIFDRRVWWRVALAFAPTAVIGLLAYPLIKGVLLESWPVMLTALAVGGLVMIGFEYWRMRRGAPRPETAGIAELSWRQCVALGVAQSLAMVPGVSRAAATIIGGQLLGIERRAIVEFSFLLAIPTMAAAAGLDLLKSAGGFSGSQLITLTIGFVVAFLSALPVIRWLLAYVSRHDFRAFGYYRLALVATILLWLGLAGVNP